MNTTNTADAARLARGLGRLAYRTHGETRRLHLVVADALAQHPGLEAAAVKQGWYAERAEMQADGDSASIGGGM